MGIVRGFFSFLNRVIRTISRIALLIALSIVSVHGYNAWQASENAETVEDRIYVLEQEWMYKALNPMSGPALGYSLPIFTIAYINLPAVERAGADLDGVKRHEGKHLQQRIDLGLVEFIKMDKWKLEGIAEYERGAPTIDICDPDPGSHHLRLAYREYYVVVRYLIEENGFDEEDIYALEDYPLEEAEAWLSQTVCTSP